MLRSRHASVPPSIAWQQKAPPPGSYAAGPASGTRPEELRCSSVSGDERECSGRAGWPRKAVGVAAVRGGLLSISEACARYRLITAEFSGSQAQVDRNG